MPTLMFIYFVYYAYKASFYLKWLEKKNVCRHKQKMKQADDNKVAAEDWGGPVMDIDQLKPIIHKYDHQSDD